MFNPFNGKKKREQNREKHSQMRFQAAKMRADRMIRKLSELEEVLIIRNERKKHSA